MPSPARKPDPAAAVLARAVDGDAAAWQTLVGLHGPRIYGLCARLMKGLDARRARECAELGG